MKLCTQNEPDREVDERMSTVRRLFKNTTILMLANSLQPLISFYLVVEISELMGAEGLGAYNTIFNYVLIFQISAAFGLRNLLTRDLAQYKEKTRRFMIDGSVIALIFSVLSLVAMSLVVQLLSDNPVVITGTMIASLSLIASGLADVYEGAIRGYERLSQIGYAWLGENLARVLISLWLVFSGYGIIELVWVFVILRFLKAGYYFYYLSRRIVVPFGAVDWQFVRELTAQARVFALTLLAVTIYWRADIIMLESMRSDAEAGLYSAAYRFLALSIVLIDSFVHSLFPVISGYFRSSPEQFQKACRKSLRLLVFVTVPMSVLMSLQAGPIITMIYSPEYEPSILVLQIIIWTLVPYGISQIFAYALVASKRQNVDMLVNITAMLANVILNFILIPRYGFIGATVATLISIHIYVGVQVPFVVQKIIHFGGREVFAGGFRVGLAILATVVTVFLMRDFHWIVSSAVAGLLYLATLFLSGAVSANDRQLIMRILRRPDAA